MRAHPLVALAAALLAATVLMQAGPAAAARPSKATPRMTCSPWKGAPTPDLPYLALADVTVTSPTNAWAVGTFVGGLDASILRWDGTAWTEVQDPLPRGGLAAVTATSDSDAWAVGSTPTLTPLVVHWDGTRWSQVPTPVPGRYNYLHAVGGLSTDYVWAVGNYTDELGYVHALAMHWDGEKWQLVRVPDSPGGDNQLFAVDILSSDDMWAVGTQGGGPFTFQPLIEHWNGTAWSEVTVTDPPGDNNQLFGVSGTSSDDVWAVGAYAVGNGRPLIYHWDGTDWTRVGTRPLPDPGDQLSDVKAIAPSDAWAVGIRVWESSSQPLSLHWNGKRWKPVSMPRRGSTAGINKLDASSGDDIWAVGSYLPFFGSADYPLAEHSNGCS